MSNKSVTETALNTPLLLLKEEIIALEQSQPEKYGKKVVLECPRCCWIFEVQRPDKLHSDCTFNKPETTKLGGEVITQPRVCRNPKCKKQFTIYWHKPAAT